MDTILILSSGNNIIKCTIPLGYRIYSKVKSSWAALFENDSNYARFYFVIPIWASLEVWFRCQKFSHCQFQFFQCKNLPAVRETWVRSLGWEDPLEEGMATHSSILAWRIPWTEEPGGLQSMGSQRVGHNWAIKHTAHIPI